MRECHLANGLWYLPRPKLSDVAKIFRRWNFRNPRGPSWVQLKGQRAWSWPFTDLFSPWSHCIQGDWRIPSHQEPILLGKTLPITELVTHLLLFSLTMWSHILDSRPCMAAFKYVSTRSLIFSYAATLSEYWFFSTLSSLFYSALIAASSLNILFILCQLLMN
jgi:hypothetical protein